MELYTTTAVGDATRFVKEYCKNNGKILEKKRARKIIDSVNCENIKVTPYGGKMRICIDGEITDAGETEFQILHKGINFVIPENRVKEEVLV